MYDPDIPGVGWRMHYDRLERVYRRLQAGNKSSIDYGDDLAHSSIRFGLGRWTTKEEVDYVADKLANVVTRLREMSPLYELAKEGVDLSTMQWQTD